MHKKAMFVVTAAILLTTIASVAICTMKAVNAQGTATTVYGSNMKDQHD